MVDGQIIYSVYDNVWVMERNKPVQKMVFAVIESMDYSKRNLHYHYRLVDNIVGVGWGNNEGTKYDLDEVFGSKEELLGSL